MAKRAVTSLILPAAIIVGILVLTQSAIAQESSTAKTARLLNESGINFSKIANDVWVIPFNGKELSSFNVLLGTQKDVLFMFVVVTEKKKFNKSPELLAKLLAQNDQMDRVKIGLDKQGDIVVRIDLTIRLLDKREFTENLDQLGAASDEVFAVIKPYLVK